MTNIISATAAAAAAAAATATAATATAATATATATAIHLMTVLAAAFDIVVDRALCAPGHRKSEADSINGVDKNTIHRKSMRKIAHAADVSDKHSSLKAHTFTAVSGQERHSPAEDCKRILEMDGSGGVKSEVKREKWERERGINKRHWHVRKLDEEFVSIKCDSINIAGPVS